MVGTICMINEPNFNFYSNHVFIRKKRNLGNVIVKKMTYNMGGGGLLFWPRDRSPN